MTKRVFYFLNTLETLNIFYYSFLESTHKDII